MHIVYAVTTCSDRTYAALFQDCPQKPAFQSQKYHRLLIEGLSQWAEVDVAATLPLNRANCGQTLLRLPPETEGGARYHYAPASRQPLLKALLGALGTYRNVRRLAKKGDAVFVDCLNCTTALFAQLAARAKGCRCVGIVTDLPEMLGGIPVVPVSARKRTGLDVLMHAVVHHYEEGPQGVVVHYDENLEEKIRQIEAILRAKYGDMENMRWHAVKLLEQDPEVMKDHPVDISHIAEKNYEKDIINEKYNYIEEVMEECMMGREEKSASTDRIDSWLTHPVFGVPIFLGIMATVFFLTFTVGDFLKGYFESGLEWFSGAVLAAMQHVQASDWLISLVVDGIVAGVGGILTFLPNIFILFLALAFLEDSGYMARVAYVMNEIMGRVGLSGKAFLPMLLGFGCTVPAVMASRALASERDRRRTILITPFMSCSARLPIYVLFSEMFFKEHAMLAAYSLYVIGLIVAIAIAFILHKREKNKDEDTLLIELPEYKTPNARTVAIYVWDKVKDYLTKAGTTIFVASIVLWFVLNFGVHGYETDVTQSFAAAIGRLLVPVLKPAGLGTWQIAVALISGLSAKEVVVSSFSVLYGISNINSAAGMAELSKVLGIAGFGMANAYALLVFCLLYSPCVAAVGTIRRETRSLKFTLQMVLFQIVLAWCFAVSIFQIGSRIL